MKDCESAIREKVKQPAEKWENETGKEGETRGSAAEATEKTKAMPTKMAGKGNDRGNVVDGNKGSLEQGSRKRLLLRETKAV